MDNKTVVFDAQKEIADLKRRVQQLENDKAVYGQPLKVSDYPPQPPIFGPGNGTSLPADWLKPYSVCQNAVEYFNGVNKKESND